MYIGSLTDNTSQLDIMSGKTLYGQNIERRGFCLYEYTVKNPYPKKKIKKIILSHMGDTEAKIILYKIMYI